MRKGEMMVVTWKRFDGAEGEQRARPSPGAFLRGFRRRGVETRDSVSSSAYSPRERGGGCLCMTEEKEMERKELNEVLPGRNESRFTCFGASAEFSA